MSAKSNYSKNYSKSENAEVIGVLKHHIAEKKPARVYLFFGTEPFLIDYYTSEIKKIIVGKDTNGLNLTVFENKVDIKNIIDACDTFPVFADKKLVLVKNSQLFRKGKGANDSDAVSGEEEESGNKNQEILKDYIPQIPESTCLLFIENNVDKRLSVYKSVAKHGLAAEFNRLRSSELVPWVMKGFRSFKKTVSPDAAQYLVAASEPDMYTLKNEILKICSYVGKRNEITLDDIKTLATPTIKSVIFDLLDAVAQRNSARALCLLDDMLAIKEPEQKILAMLAKQTGELLKMKILLDKGASQTRIEEYFQGKHPYALKIMMQQARAMDEKYLRNLLHACMEADTGSKKGLIDLKLALEVILSSINS